MGVREAFDNMWMRAAVAGTGAAAACLLAAAIMLAFKNRAE
jgi:hypothetical protein